MWSGRRDSTRLGARTRLVVRLNVGGLTVPDEFALLLFGDGVVRENTYKKVWHHGHEGGAKLVRMVRPGFALQA